MARRYLIPDVVRDQDLICMAPDRSVRDAVEKMVERRIGAVLITEGGVLKGIFTERDLTARVVASGRNPEKTKLFEVMTADPASLPPEATAEEALELMEERKFRHLPIVRGNQAVGVVSIRDLFSEVRKNLEGELEDRDTFLFGSGYSVNNLVAAR